MARLRVTCGRVREPALPELAVEKLYRDAHRLLCKHRVVARTFVAQESVRRVKLEPLIVGARLFKRLVNLRPPLEGHVGILPSPNHQQFPPDRPLASALQGVVRHSCAEPSGMGFDLVDVRRVEADAGQNLRMKTRPEIEMPSDTNPKSPQSAGTQRVFLQKLNHGKRIRVISSKGLVDLSPVSPVCPLGFVGQDFTQRLKLVKDLGNGDNETLRGKESSGPADGTCDVENF